MQIDRCGDGFFGVFGELGEDAGDQAGEDVARATGAHGGGAGGVDPDAAIGERDDGAVAFEHQREAMIHGEIAGRADAIFLHLGDGLFAQPGHFAGMRGQ